MSAWKKWRWVPVTACIVGATVVACAHSDGWGNFLFVAVLFAIDW